MAYIIVNWDYVTPTVTAKAGKAFAGVYRVPYTADVDVLTFKIILDFK